MNGKAARKLRGIARILCMEQGDVVLEGEPGSYSTQEFKRLQAGLSGGKPTEVTKQTLHCNGERGAYKDIKKRYRELKRRGENGSK